MKIVLCQINSKYVHSPLAPWCLKAGLKAFAKNIYDCKIVEGTINENYCLIKDRIISEKPDIVGLSCYIWNMDSVINVSKSIKDALPNVKIVLGGPEVSYNQCEVLSLYRFCDYIISGEGEKPFAKLCDSIFENNAEPLDGVSYRTEKGFIISDPFIDSDDPPSPYCDEYFESLKGRISYLETSRGCPYRCAFCLSGRCGGARFFDYQRALNDAIALANSGSKTIKLVDRTFNANKKRAKDFWKFIIEEHGKKIPEDVCFHFEIAGDILDEESLNILKNAPLGAIQLEIGLQSFNENTLAYINRKTDTEKLVKNIIRLISFRNMHIHIDLIAGLPFEDLISFRESFNKAYALNPDMLQLGFLKLLHGADMREDRIKYPSEFRKTPPYEVISTEWTSKEDLIKLHNTEDALERLCNSKRFTKTLEYVFKVFNGTPYDFFFGIGNWLSDRMDYKIDLDSYTSLIYEYISKLPGINKDILYDMLIIDRLTSSSSGKLPEFLKCKRDIIRKIRIITENDTRYIKEKNVKRGFALLKSENTAIICDYIKKDYLSGRYPYRTFDYSNEI